jgi:hypothetical protein
MTYESYRRIESVGDMIGHPPTLVKCPTIETTASYASIRTWNA